MSLRILIVDDSPVARRFVRRVLELSGLPVAAYLEAEDGLSAIEVLRALPVDVMIADVNMPKMNGEDLIRYLDAQDELRHLAVIVVSTDSTAVRVQRLMKFGARGYVSKPFSPETLRAEIERVLEVQREHARK